MPMLPLLFVILLTFLKPACAVMTRADRDDAEYLELATRYTATIALPAGEGVLIAPRWILTSRAVARGLEREQRGTIDVASKRHAVAAVFAPGPGDEGVALVFLREPVDGIVPTPIYRHDDERGRGVVIVGHGGTGHIGATPTAAEAADRRARGAINTVDRVEPRFLDLVVKPDDEASDLQGAAAAGDRAAPAFMQTPEGLFVAGLALPAAQTVKVGAVDRYLRASAYAAWIDETMFRAAVAETSGAPKRR